MTTKPPPPPSSSKPAGAKFIVVSRPRSGTTYFCNWVLSSHPRIFCYDELFNRSENTRKYLNEIGLEPFHPSPAGTLGDRLGFSNRQLDRYIEQHYQKAAAAYAKPKIGFKLFGEQITPNQYKHLLGADQYRIIFLYRRNYLQTAISYAIAKQTNQWDVRTRADFSIEIQPETIAETLHSLRHYVQLTLDHLQQQRRDFLLLEYEQLNSLEAINRAFAFLEESPLRELPAGMGKLNDEKRYHCVTNIDQIEREFGNPDNGYLFEKRA